jgi:DNA-binding NtrC family response regulator
MAARETIAVLRTEADAALAASIQHILVGIPRNHAGPLRIEEVRCAGAEPLPDLCRRSRPDLAIVIVPAEAPSLAQRFAARLANTSPRCPVLAVLPESLAPEAQHLLNAGVSDFVLPPVRPQDLVPRVVHLLRPREPEDELLAHLKRVVGSRQIVGRSPILMAQLRKLPLFAGCDATVLITGETGTGKELCARAVHYCSRRSGRPFVGVDCGAIPADLIENELFGHERGAYTTALTAQTGLLREASGGSLFLDEIESLPLPMQCKLLRFLQEKEYRPLGSAKSRHADVRVIAAANKSLEETVRAGRFRQDLYYRLNVLSLVMPPLRDRREDIPLLARHFVDQYAAEFSRPARALSEAAIKRLLNHSWPGNARELENTIERAVLLCDTPQIEVQHIELSASEPEPATLSYRARKEMMIAKWERQELTKALTLSRGNVSAAAKSEGKDPGAFRALLRKHHLRPTRESPHWILTV